jgi:spermidine synthase
VGKAFFANTLSTTFGDPRLKLMFDDAARYLKQEGKQQGYDVIICDSSDPVGPAEVLFQPEFFLSMKDALAPGGVICTQGENMWLHLDLISKVRQSPPLSFFALFFVILFFIILFFIFFIIFIIIFFL